DDEEHQRADQQPRERINRAASPPDRPGLLAERGPVVGGVSDRHEPAASFLVAAVIAAMACATVRSPVAAACRLVFTAREKSGYQVGAPCGNTGRTVVFSMLLRVSPPSSSPL